MLCYVNHILTSPPGTGQGLLPQRARDAPDRGRAEGEPPQPGPETALRRRHPGLRQHPLASA